jgi:hypothetical protein
MPYNNKDILKDAKGNPIPQIFDPVDDVYKPLTQMNYYGYSTETKPTNVPKNATFYEYDTRKGYIFTGSTWVVL